MHKKCLGYRKVINKIILNYKTIFTTFAGKLKNKSLMKAVDLWVS